LIVRSRFDCSDASRASRLRRNDYMLNVHRNVTATGGYLLVGDPCLGDC
jgi:hypothetical protein